MKRFIEAEHLPESKIRFIPLYFAFSATGGMKSDNEVTPPPTPK